MPGLMGIVLCWEYLGCKLVQLQSPMSSSLLLFVGM